jgi:6-phosphogluconolactonase
MSERVFASRESLDSALATEIARHLDTAVTLRSSATLVVSGGSTPRGLFAQLADTDIAWDRVTVTLADDRWVPPDHNDSNEKMVRELLLVGRAADAQLLSLIADHPDVEANLQRVKDALASIPVFDVVVLGMGLDAHTASLFPCAAELAEGMTTEEDALMVTPSTAPHRRITMSRKRIAKTRFGVMHIVGDEKRAVLAQAITANQPEQYPAASFVRGHSDFRVYWAA